jgi:Arc/MetJ-type ribon-helix-helix transcriptional regulator
VAGSNKQQATNSGILAARKLSDRRYIVATQMIIRVEQSLKDKVSRLAKSEGKNLSELVRELLEKYTKERDMGAYIDNLWDKIGRDLSKNNISDSDIENMIKQTRLSNAK